MPLRETETPFRNPEVMCDWRGFDRARLVSIRTGIVTDVKIEPAPVTALPPADFPKGPFRYPVRNDLHRFYASVAPGFECRPVVVQ
jgi:hypothetical protein